LFLDQVYVLNRLAMPIPNEISYTESVRRIFGWETSKLFCVNTGSREKAVSYSILHKGRVYDFEIWQPAVGKVQMGANESVSTDVKSQSSGFVLSVISYIVLVHLCSSVSYQLTVQDKFFLKKLQEWPQFGLPQPGSLVCDSHASLCFILIALRLLGKDPNTIEYLGEVALTAGSVKSLVCYLPARCSTFFSIYFFALSLPNL
jgi:hypothetical protein